jgi:hypothetical protein
VRQPHKPRQSPAEIERRFSLLRSRFANLRLLRPRSSGGAGLTGKQVRALERANARAALHARIVQVHRLLEEYRRAANELRADASETHDLEQGIRALHAYDAKLAREVLGAWRGDKPPKDEPCIEEYARQDLAELGSEYDKALADSGAVYITTDQGIRHPGLVNVDDLTRESREALGALYSSP